MIPVGTLGLIGIIAAEWSKCPAVPSAQAYIVLSTLAGLLGAAAQFYYRTNKLPDMMQEPTWPLDGGKKTKLWTTLLVAAITIWGAVIVFPRVRE